MVTVFVTLKNNYFDLPLAVWEYSCQVLEAVPAYQVQVWPHYRTFHRPPVEQLECPGFWSSTADTVCVVCGLVKVDISGDKY